MYARYVMGLRHAHHAHARLNKDDCWTRIRLPFRWTECVRAIVTYFVAQEERWVAFPELALGARGCAAAVSIGGRIFVIGGAHSEARLTRVESVDPREGRYAASFRMHPISLRMHSCKTLSIHVRLCIHTFLCRWRMEPSLNVPRAALAAVAIPHKMQVTCEQPVWMTCDQLGEP